MPAKIFRSGRCESDGCNQPAVPGRPVCWSCWNYKKRYGLTAPEITLKTTWSLHCCLCGKRRKFLDKSLGKEVCKGCYMALRLYRQEGWRRAAERLLNPPATPTPEK